MNGKKSRIIYRLLPMIMIPLVSCLLLSCFNEDEDCPTTDGNGKVLVQLQIKTNGISDLNATRAEDTADGITETREDGEYGEFMNKLCIFIVDKSSGEIEVKLQPDLSGTAADSGNLEEYTTEEFELYTGSKTIYAFANWDKTESDEWSELIDKEEGQTISASDLSFTIEDPASKVDIAESSYIPMSGKEEIGDLDSRYSRNLISIGLDRLVGKVTVTVVGDEYDINVNKIYFKGTADRVSLFQESNSDMTFGEIENKTVETGITPTVSTVPAKSEETEIATFYINESYRTESSNEDISGSGYTITLDMETTNNYDKFDGSEYKAMTTTQDVQRNYIYPIKLQFDTYNVEFEIQAWTAPIDLKAETEYTTSAEWHEDGDGYYQITLRDITSSFTITPKLYQISEDVSGDRLKTEQSGITWEWIQGDDDEYILSQSESDGTLTVTQLTAMADYYYSFKLNAKWSTTTNGITIEHERTYNVKVVLSEGDFSLDGGDTYYQIKRMLPLVAK